MASLSGRSSHQPRKTSQLWREPGESTRPRACPAALNNIGDVVLLPPSRATGQKNRDTTDRAAGLLIDGGCMAGRSKCHDAPGHQIEQETLEKGAWLTGPGSEKSKRR